MTGIEDKGTHTVCAYMNKKFLDFTKSKGNDLSSVVKPGDANGVFVKKMGKHLMQIRIQK